MNCPFCKIKLVINRSSEVTQYCCYNAACAFHDMTRYKCIYNNYHTYIIAKIFILNNLYININYENELTKISKLDSSIILDTVSIAGILKADLNNLDELNKKINLILLFS